MNKKAQKSLNPVVAIGTIIGLIGILIIMFALGDLKNRKGVLVFGGIILGIGLIICYFGNR